LRREESIADGLRRLTRKELRSAAGHLGPRRPSEDAIHEARKSVKKVRAIAQLMKADDGKGLRGVDKRLRSVNRALSGPRDADAMKEILAKLRARNPQLFSEHTFARLERQLDAHKREATRQAMKDRVFAKAAEDLADLRADAKGWKPAHKRFRALKEGTLETHRRGRRAMKRATGRQGSADFHEWRKQIKALWYKLRLIDCCSANLRKDLRALNKAEEYLGDEHNIAVFCGHVSADPSIVQAPFDFVRLQRAANGYQQELRRKALSSARRIFQMKSRAYLRRVKIWWKAWDDRPLSQKQRSRAAA
jgi:CHAD domain-containing protein